MYGTDSEENNEEVEFGITTGAKEFLGGMELTMAPLLVHATGFGASGSLERGFLVGTSRRSQIWQPNR